MQIQELYVPPAVIRGPAQDGSEANIHEDARIKMKGLGYDVATDIPS